MISIIDETFYSDVKYDILNFSQTKRADTTLRKFLCQFIELDKNWDDYVLHHIDGNHANNSYDNLALVPSQEHASYHKKVAYALKNKNNEKCKRLSDLVDSYEKTNRRDGKLLKDIEEEFINTCISMGCFSDIIVIKDYVDIKPIRK